MMVGGGGGAACGVETGNVSGNDGIHGLCCTGEKGSATELVGGGGAKDPSPPNAGPPLSPGIMANESKLSVANWPRSV